MSKHSEKEKTAPPSNLSPVLEKNMNELKKLFTDCSDVIYRPFLIGEKGKAVLIYLDGFADIHELDSNVLKPLKIYGEKQKKADMAWIQEHISVAKWTGITSLKECSKEIAMGRTVLLADGENTGLSLGLLDLKNRSIEEPSAQTVIKGPREGFIETLSVNISLIRRRIKTHNLKMKSMEIGRDTRTEVAVMYISNIADEKLVEEVFSRLGRIDIDGVIESQYIEEMIEDQPWSPFPQIVSTERPDSCAASLLEGRVIIMADGSPSVLIAPATLLTLLQSAEDYYQRYILGTAIRLLRYLYIFISLLLPSLYVAVLSYHQEMLPTKLLISVSTSREIVPFPAIVEALIMEVTFEAIREAGVRLPKQIGSAVSIAGALVIGQAAIQTGLVSPPMVMVVALTGIASFTIPAYNLGATLRLLRFPMMALAGTLGVLGIMIGLLAIITHLCSLRSFGVPYLSGFSPGNSSNMKDTVIRAPWWMQSSRPHMTGKYNRERQRTSEKPGPPKGGA